MSNNLTRSVWVQLTFKLLLLLFCAGLLQPKALTFSDVSSRSFRTSWEIEPSADLESFLVQFRPADNPDGHWVVLSVPANERSALLPHLQPLTRYMVEVQAQYPKGSSLPASGQETTSEGTQMRLCFRCTIFSNISWPSVANWRSFEVWPVGSVTQ